MEELERLLLERRFSEGTKFCYHRIQFDGYYYLCILNGKVIKRCTYRDLYKPCTHTCFILVYVARKRHHVFYLTLKKFIDYETQKEKKISSRPSA